METENPVEAAKKIIEAEKKERQDKAGVAFDALCKEYNVDFVQVAQVGNGLVRISDILKLPVFFNIEAK